MLTPEQLARRRGGIGSSDIAAIADLDPHRAPIDVWLDKLGLAESARTIQKRMGDKAEPVIAELYAEDTGAQLEQGSTMRHARHPIALATPDRIARFGDARRIVEIKNVGGFMVYLWVDGPPIDKILQVQWQLEVCDFERADLAVGLGGTDFRIWGIWRDRDLGADLLELAELFWVGHVETRIPPPHDGAAARRLAAKRWPQNTHAMLPTSDEAEALRDRLLRIKRMAKRIGDVQGQLEARACAMIGEHDGIKDCFTWKAPKGSAPSWKERARALWMQGAEASFETMERGIGDDEARWETIARRAGAVDALAKDERTGRRFLVKEPRATNGKGGRR